MSEKAQRILGPPPHFLGLNKRFVSQDPTTLIITEHANSFSGNDFTIKTADDGQTILLCHGQVMSFSGRKEFTTPEGEHLFTLRRRAFAVPRQWYLELPDESGEVLAIDSKFKIGKSKLEATFRNTLHNGDEVCLKINGEFFNRSAEITCDDVPVAVIRRKINAKDILLGVQTYEVQVAPDVDIALIAALCVGWDESHRKPSGGVGGGG